jgi:hypothetical protein
MEYARTSNLSAVAVYLAMLLGAQAAQIGKFHTSHVLHMNASVFGGFARRNNMPCRKEMGRCISPTMVR